MRAARRHDHALTDNVAHANTMTHLLAVHRAVQMHAIVEHLGASLVGGPVQWCKRFGPCVVRDITNDIEIVG